MTEHVVRLVNIEQPGWVATSHEFHALLREFVDKYLPQPSLNFESILNYICSNMDMINIQRISHIPPDVIKSKLIVGYEDDKMSGFIMFYQLPNRLPHIMTMEIPYMYSRSLRVSYEMTKEVRRLKRKWGCKYIVFAAVTKNGKDSPLARVVMRGFKKPVYVGKIYVVEDIRNMLIKPSQNGGE